MHYKSSEHLFNLVKSMSRHEKRNFKRFLTRHPLGEKTIYKRVFDEMARMAVYDESHLLNKFSGEEFTRHFSVTKNQLYHQLLKSLAAGHYSADRKINDLIHYVQILYEKNMFDACRKLILKAKKLAVMHEKTERLLEIEKVESQILLAEFKIKEFRAFYNGHIRRNTDLANLIQNENDYRKIYYELVMLLEKGILPRKTSELKTYDAIIKKPLLKSIEKAKTFMARYYFHSCWFLYYWVKKDAASNYANQVNLTRLFESRPDFIKQEFDKYITCLSNLIITQGLLGRHAEALKTIKKLRSSPDEYLKHVQEGIMARVFSRSYNLELETFISTGDFLKGVSIEKEVIKGLSRYRNISHDFQIMLLFQLFHVNFGNRTFVRSLYFLNKVLQHKKLRLMPELDAVARIANIILHYELGNTDILEYLVKSAGRYLKVYKRQYRLETALLDFIKKSGVGTRADRKMFSVFKENILQIIKDPMEKRFLEHFNILRWVEDKM